MILIICMKAYPPTNFGRRTHWPPGGPPRKARAFRCTDFLELCNCKRGGNGVGIMSADYLPRMVFPRSSPPPPLPCALRLPKPPKIDRMAHNLLNQTNRWLSLTILLLLTETLAVTLTLALTLSPD